MLRFKLTALLLVSTWLTACVDSSFTETKRLSGFRADEVKELYVYSFLDARQKHDNEEFRHLFEQSLSSQMQARGVSTHWLWLKESPIGSVFFATEKNKPDELIPVHTVLLLNSNQERATGSTHRLVVIPESVEATGARHAGNPEYRTELSWTLIPRGNGGWPIFKGTSNFHGSANKDDAVLRSDVEKLVNDFINGIYP